MKRIQPLCNKVLLLPVAMLLISVFTAAASAEDINWKKHKLEHDPIELAFPFEMKTFAQKKGTVYLSLDFAPVPDPRYRIYSLLSKSSDKKTPPHKQSELKKWAQEKLMNDRMSKFQKVVSTEAIEINGLKIIRVTGKSTFGPLPIPQYHVSYAFNHDNKSYLLTVSELDQIWDHVGWERHGIRTTKEASEREFKRVQKSAERFVKSLKFHE